MNRTKRFRPLAAILAGALVGGVACQSPSSTSTEKAASEPAPASEVQARLVYFAIPG